MTYNVLRMIMNQTTTKIVIEIENYNFGNLGSNSFGY